MNIPVSLNDFILILFGLLTFAMAITWLGFARLSMARIERAMDRDGLARPSQWDVMGLRVLWFATAIAFDKPLMHRADEPFIDVKAVRRYATPFDKKLSIAFLISGYSFCLVGIIGYWLLDK